MGSPPLLTGRQKIVRFVRNGLAALVASVTIVYLVDYGILRYRMAAHQEPFGSVMVRPLYAVPQKDHRIEYMPGDPMDQDCVHSLFPHAGDAPCWYLRSHQEQRIDM